MGSKSSKSTNSNPVTTGYGYAGETGFQASGIGDDLVDGGSLSAGSGFNLSNLSSSDGLTVNYSKTTSDKDVLSAAGQAIGDAFKAFTGAGTQRNRDALNYSSDVTRGSIQAVDRAGQRNVDVMRGTTQALDRAGQRSNDLFKGFTQALDRGRQRTTNALDRAGQRQVAVQRGTTQALDRASQRQLAVQRGTTQALDRAGQRSNEIAKYAMSESSDNAQAALDSNAQATHDAINAATDLSGLSMEHVADAYGSSRESLEGIVGLGFEAASDAYQGALSSMQQNASDTADAFARASGGQSQETQITVRKTMLIMGGVVAISMIAANWN